MWPFNRNRTYVYVAKREGMDRGWWTSPVVYDPWGEPTLRGGPFFFDTWETMLTDGGAGYQLEWKHKSGPPVDFTRKFARNPPI